MSSGRLIMRGWAFQGRVFRPWALAGGAVATVAYETRIGNLHGAKKSRGILSGASKEIGTLTGAN
jgi:hypothetical protein